MSSTAFALPSASNAAAGPSRAVNGAATPNSASSSSSALTPGSQALASGSNGSASNGATAKKNSHLGFAHTGKENDVNSIVDGVVQEEIAKAQQVSTEIEAPAPGSALNLPKPQLQNIVSTTDLGCRLDLKTIALHARNAEYNPKRFAAVIMRIREPKTTALIFASGKMVVTGAKSEDEARLASRKYTRIIQKLGFTAEFKDFKIQNIVGSTDVRFPIRLEGLAYAHGAFSSYEPELFPGLIYRMVKPKVVLLIFVSGKVVLTGAKHRDDIQSAFDNIYPVLLDFKKA